MFVTAHPPKLSFFDMNYLAHGIRFLDNPYFLAGTATPDWLSASDRKTRLRPRMIEPYLTHHDQNLVAFGHGVLQHFEDDSLFHESLTFCQTTALVTGEFKKHLGKDDGFRPSFLGHIVSEMLLDRWLMLQNTGILTQYYGAFEAVEPHKIQSYVNMMAKTPAQNLAKFITFFQEVRFLEDYKKFPLFLGRLNQVQRRVKLQELHSSIEQVLIRSYDIVSEASTALLPFTWDLQSSE